MIVVVGAGISGLSLAYALLKQGQEVTVLEAGGIASQTSGIATSYLEPRLGVSSIRILERAAHKLWPAFVSEVEQFSGQSVSFKQTGLIKVSRPEHEIKFRMELEQRQTERWPCQRLEHHELIGMEPALSRDISDAALYPEVSWMDGAAFCAALATCIRKSGGRILENWKVTHIDETDSGVSIRRDLGDKLEASKIAICNAMGRNEITGLAADVVHCQPIRGVTLVIDQSTLSTPLTHLIKHHAGHLCPLSSKKLIVGTTYEKTVSDLTVSDATTDLLYARARLIVPNIRDLPLIEINSGLRARSPDGTLQIGRSRSMPRVYFSLGHGGSGYLRAPIVMEALANFLTTGEKSGPAAFLISS